MATVAELQDQLQKSDGGLVLSPQAGTPAAMAPAARLAWLRQALSELDLESSFLDDASALVARASAMRSSAVMASQQASVRRAEAVQRLATDQGATLAEAATQWQAQAVWLDTQPPMSRPIALQIADDAAKRVEGEIHAQILGHAPRLWDLAQRKAREIVAEVAALPEMPLQLWQVSAPAAEFARWREHRGTFGVLTAAYTDFELCHAIGGLVRDTLGYGYARFPQGSTRAALWLKTASLPASPPRSGSGTRSIRASSRACGRLPTSRRAVLRTGASAAGLRISDSQPASTFETSMPGVTA